MTVILSIIFALLLLTQFPNLASESTDEPHFVGYNCPLGGYSYTTNSKFQQNLNTTLFTHLKVNASRLTFSSHTAGEGVDRVYAMYYCTGRVGTKMCSLCVQSAAMRVLKNCKFLKQGIVWFKECTLRYANHSIFSLSSEDLTIHYPSYNYTPVLGDYLNQYRTVFDSTMDGLIEQAANNESLNPHGFATKRVNLSGSQTLYRLVQCAPIITGSDCQSCLTAAVRVMDLWADSMEFLPACLVGFSILGFPPPPPRPPSSSSLPVGIKVLIPLLSLVVILSLLSGIWFWKRRRMSKGNQYPPPERERNDFLIPEPDKNEPSQEDNPEGGEIGRQHGLARFSYSQVEDMTNGFTNRIGEGGFAVVYHGCLTDTNKEVAVKMFSKNEAPKQFSTEIEVLGRISHKNLVSLVGYCEEGTNLALIYEFMASGDLKGCLSEHSIVLSWRKRVEIALDTAQGLDYLHNGCSPPIVHRDVKPANILLNKDYKAKVSDFGFSKIFPAEYVSNLQTRVVGTLGYLDPQYNLTGQVNEKGDVYSFGIVLLELITGKTAIVNRVMNLGQWVRSILEKGDIGSILDDRVKHDVDNNYLTVWKTVELAVRCIQLESAERPTMNQIVTELKDCLTMLVSGSSSSAKDSLEMLSAAVSSNKTMSPTAR